MTCCLGRRFSAWIIRQHKRNLQHTVFCTWSWYALGLKRDAQVRVLKRMQNARLVIAINRWRNNSNKQRRQAASIERVVRRFGMRGAAMAMATWRERCDAAAREREVMGRVVARMQLRSLLRGALEDWRFGRGGKYDYI